MSIFSDLFNVSIFINIVGSGSGLIINFKSRIHIN
jgi:hypothetical protein